MFSEPFKPLSQFKSLNETLMGTQGVVFKVDYVSKLARDDPNRPVLHGFRVQNVTDYDLIIKLNISKPLYVSQGQTKDELTISFPNSFLF